MVEIDEYSLEPFKGELPQSHLLRHGRRTGLLLDGVVLERQFRTAQGALLFLTEDCPHEEGLHIYFLNAESAVLDALELGAAYAPGILSILATPPGERIAFSFFGGDEWEVAVMPRPKFGFGPSALSGVRRKRTLPGKRWLRISRTR
ncbi:MAG: hypothetical protein KJZ84_05400 [Bryobacteraceae bacterium]|nr:hypothetical protein [Bryobacteraceae bacterium]